MGVRRTRPATCLRNIPTTRTSSESTGGPTTRLFCPRERRYVTRTVHYAPLLAHDVDHCVTDNVYCDQTNPVPMGKRYNILYRIRSHDASLLEAILLQDPLVHAAIIFGRGRFQNGVIIQPKEPFESSDEAKLEEFRNAVWCVHRPLDQND